MNGDGRVRVHKINCLKAFSSHASDLSVLIQLDNATAVAYINKRGEGCSRSTALNQITVYIITWCKGRRLNIQAVHLPGCLNFVADHESRCKADSSDWRLSPVLFAKPATFLEMKVDLFASQWNTQLKKFVSWLPQTDACRTNALAFSWRDLKAYAFSPFALIKGCLFKLRREQAEVVLICPHWSGQPWFPLLLEKATDILFILPVDQRTLVAANGRSSRIY